MTGKTHAACANHADSNGSVRDSSKPLLRNIIESADAAIANPSQAATLRFAHDSNITPLAALMGIETYDVAWREPETLYQHWTDFKVSPRGGSSTAFVRPHAQLLSYQCRIFQEQNACPAGIAP